MTTSGSIFTLTLVLAIGIFIVPQLAALVFGTPFGIFVAAFVIYLAIKE